MPYTATVTCRAKLVSWLPSLAPFSLGQVVSFTPIGDLPGGQTYSGATGVSADAAVVAGSGTNAESTQAFRWTAVGDFRD